jgi:uncharacterized membrane protein
MVAWMAGLLILPRCSSITCARNPDGQLFEHAERRLLRLIITPPVDHLGAGPVADPHTWGGDPEQPWCT